MDLLCGILFQTCHTSFLSHETGHPRLIIENAIKHGATAMVFAHNHPAGDPKPSRSDRQLTRDMIFAGKLVQITVLDHIIIGGNKYFSFAEAGLL